MIRIFEPEETPEIRVGMRMVKTVVAVYICAAIGCFFRGEAAIISMVAAVVCMQNTTENSMRKAADRVLGTIIGAMYGVLVRYIGIWLGISDKLFVYYFMISITLIPLLLSTLVIKKPSISSFACTLFLSVAVGHVVNPLEASIERIVETVVGIVVALLVNTILPKRRLGLKEQKAEKKKELEQLQTASSDSQTENEKPTN